MPSMPRPVSDDQDASTASEVILGVDTHKDRYVAAGPDHAGCAAKQQQLPGQPPPATGHCWPGWAGSGCCGGPGWNTPALTCGGTVQMARASVGGAVTVLLARARLTMWNRPAAGSPGSGVMCSTGGWPGSAGSTVSSLLGRASYTYF